MYQSNIHLGRMVQIMNIYKGYIIKKVGTVYNKNVYVWNAYNKDGVLVGWDFQLDKLKKYLDWLFVNEIFDGVCKEGR